MAVLDEQIWQRVKAVFDLAVERPAVERPALLDGLCQGDALLRGRVEALLAAHEEEEAAAARSPTVGPERLADTAHGARLEAPGARIGPYKLLEQIGEGGFGLVFMAEQEQPLRRRVALKLIKAGMDSKEVLARFEIERQALALMDHPNIARALDADRTETGRPYFVMELVRGSPITDYCSDHKLTPRERLQLFIAVCQAVQHAHQKGVIHRDIKPSNVLVTVSDDGPIPKVIDFGVAKALHQKLTDLTVFTGLRQMIGTPAYMSPEQTDLNAVDIDTRSDIYSLGVLLYELLTGTTPFDAETLRNATFDEMRRIIREVVPPTPSMRVASDLCVRRKGSGIRGQGSAESAGRTGPDPRSPTPHPSSLIDFTRHRGTDPAALRRLLRGELDSIVMKCLSKERERRYQTAGELGRDISHYLAGEPIEAKRDSALYVFRKQWGRYRGSLVVAAAFVVVLVASSVVAWALYGQARQRLWESYLTSARAIRQTTLPGRKLKSLKAISQATALRPSRELRDEAIAVLALMDVRLLQEISGPPGTDAGFPPSLDPMFFYCSDGGLARCTVHRWGADKPFLDLSSPDYQLLWPCFSHDGRLLTVCGKSECQIWDLERAVVRSGFPLELASATNGCFRPDDQQFAVADRHGAVHTHDLETHETHMFPVPNVAIERVVYRPDGKVLAVVPYDRTDVLLMDLTVGQVTGTLPHADIVNGVAWSPDGRTLAVGCDDGQVYLWNSDDKIIKHKLVGHTGLPVSLFFYARGSRLCSYAWDGRSRFWDAYLGTHLLTLDRQILVIGQDGRRFAYQVSGQAPRVGIGEILESNVFATLYPSGSEIRRPCFSVAASNDGRLAVTSGFRETQLWDLASAQLLATIPINDVGTVLFRAADSELVTSGASSGVRRWPIQRQGDRVRIGPPTLASPPAWGCPDACLAADDCTLAVAVNGWDIGIINLQDPKTPGIIGQHPNARYVTISPDGKWVASGGDHQGPDGQLRIWDAKRRKLVISVPAPVWQQAQFSHDGRWLAITSLSNHQLWETGTWQLRAEFACEPNGPLASAAFSPASDVLAVTVDDRSIELVDLARLRTFARLECPNSIGKEALAFGADGAKLLVPNACGHTLHVWDLRTLRERLAEMGLDWDLPAYPPAQSTPTNPLSVEVDLGQFDDSGNGNTE